jgi:hypothetical protein
MSSTALLGIILIIRFSIAAAQRGPAARREEPWRQPRASGWAALVWILLVPAAGGLFFGLLSGALWCGLVLAPVIVAIAPWPVARYLFIPLGMPRVAYRVTSISDWTWRLDRPGGAALAAAWALCRGGRRDDGAAEWLDRKLELGAGVSPVGEGITPHPLRGAGLCAAAMLAAYRGDLDGARALFESVSLLDDRACPPEARRVAAGWLAAEAAARGDWRAVADRGAGGPAAGRDVWLLAGIAARLLDDPGAPSAPELWLRWALAPHRHAMLPLVRRAIAARSGAPRPAPAEPEVRATRVAEGDLWSRAVMLHATLLLRRRGELERPAAAEPRPAPITGDDLRRLGGAWDAAFEDDRAQAEVRERARSIGASSHEAALGPLRRAVEGDLAAMAREARIPRRDWEDLGATIGRASRLLRDELLAEIELACDRIRRRVDERRELPPADELREWLALRAQYERAADIAGVELRRLAFAKVHADVCHLAVWLFNTRKERPIGNAMFRWLLAEAEALDDARAIELQRKNVDCGV